MIYVYANANIIPTQDTSNFCEMEPTRQTRSYRIPCSVSIAKPNYLRVNLAQADLERRSDDAREILGRRKNQKLRRRAAGRRADQRALSGRKFCESVNLGPFQPFWTSPQLVLLFAKDPKRFYSRRRQAKIAEPKYSNSTKRKTVRMRPAPNRRRRRRAVLWIARNKTPAMRIAGRRQLRRSTTQRLSPQELISYASRFRRL